MFIINRIKDFFLDNLYYPLRDLPFFDAVMTLVIGILGGVFPVPAVTSLCTGVLGTIAGFSTAQNAIAIAVNLLMTPVQFILLPYFADASLILFPIGGNEMKPSEKILAAFSSGDFVGALKSTPLIIAAACLPWLALTVIALLIYRAGNKTTKHPMDGQEGQKID